jgi:hypothetical protein
MKIHLTIEVNPWSWRGLRRLVVVGIFVLAIALPAVVWASDDFFDVPDDQLFHAQISAIAGAGITTGCGDPAARTYCPEDFVRRDAMAAFMHRGFSRVGMFSYLATITQTTDSASATVGSGTITVGLPSNALAGATGFLEGHASITIYGPSSGCPCGYQAALYDLTDADYFSATGQILTVSDSESGHITLSGAIDTTISGAHTIQLRVWRVSGTGTGARAHGDATVSYHPFGSTGGSTP